MKKYTFQSNEIYGKRYTVQAVSELDAKLKLQSFIYLQLFDRIDPKSLANANKSKAAVAAQLKVARKLEKNGQVSAAADERLAYGEDGTQPEFFETGADLKRWISKHLTVKPVISTDITQKTRATGKAKATTAATTGASEASDHKQQKQKQQKRKLRRFEHDESYGKPRRPWFLEDCEAFQLQGVQIINPWMEIRTGMDHSVLEDFCEDNGRGLSHLLRNIRKKSDLGNPYEMVQCSECIVLNAASPLTREEMELLLGHKLPKKVTVMKEAVIMDQGQLKKVEVETTQLIDPDTGKPYEEPSYANTEAFIVARTLHIG